MVEVLLLIFFLKSFLLLLIKHTECKVKLSNQTNLEIFLAIVFCGRLARRSGVLLLWQGKHWALYTAERRLLHRAVPCLLKRRWEVWTLWSFGSIVLWKKVLNLFCWFSTTDNSQSDEVRHVFFFGNFDYVLYLFENVLELRKQFVFRQNSNILTWESPMSDSLNEGENVISL